MAIKDRRKVFMDYLDAILNTLDPSGANSKLYHEKFDKMSDNQFDKFFKELFANESSYLIVILNDSLKMTNKISIWKLLNMNVI